MEDDVVAAVSGAVGEESCEEDDEEGEEVGRRGESLGGERGVVHSGLVSVWKADGGCFLPYSWMIVGRKGGKLENATLQLKNMNYLSQLRLWQAGIQEFLYTAVIQHFTSVKASRISRQSRPDLSVAITFSNPLALSPPSLARATFLSRRLRYLAESGVSGIWYHAAAAKTILGSPSTRNSNLQAAMGNRSPAFVISQARLPAKEVARGAAEMKRPVRRASSSRLKKNESRKGTPGEKAASPTPRRTRIIKMERNDLANAWEHANILHDSTQRDTYICAGTTR